MATKVARKPPAKKTSRIAERYAQLARDLIAERGGPEAHGAQASAAKALGMSKSYLNKIVLGHRRAGVTAAERAASLLGFKMEFFTSEREGSYREFPASRGARLPVGALPDAVPAFGPVRQALEEETDRFRRALNEAHRLHGKQLANAPIADSELRAYVDLVVELRHAAAAFAAKRAPASEQRRLALESVLAFSRLPAMLGALLDASPDALIAAGLVDGQPFDDAPDPGDPES